MCVAPPFTSGIRDDAPAKLPARETWFNEPAKVFYYLYFVGSKIHSSWALTTSAGIILIDTLFTYNSEEEIVGGLKKLGLDPAQVKYVIASRMPTAIMSAEQKTNAGSLQVAHRHGRPGLGFD